MNEQYTIQPMNLEQAGRISSELKKKLVKKQYEKDVIRRVSIATYEAEVNTVIHSHGGTCTIHYGKNKLKVVFEDTGPGIEDIEMAMKEGFSTASSFAREHGFGAGMGLPNIRRSCDFFHIVSSPDGTKLTMEFQLEKKHESI